jgi:amino-acid N-acetyltransferase
MTINNVHVRQAKIRDVPRMLDIINGFAREGLMLSRGPQIVFEDIRDFMVLVDDEDVVRGTGAFHVYWNDVGEIRSVAVERELQKRGYGILIVKALLKEAERLEIPRVYVFTYAPGFFKKLGFKTVRKEDLPQKMYAECANCPKYFFCDEIAMLLHLKKED